MFFTYRAIPRWHDQRTSRGTLDENEPGISCALSPALYVVDYREECLGSLFERRTKTRPLEEGETPARGNHVPHRRTHGCASWILARMKCLSTCRGVVPHSATTA